MELPQLTDSVVSLCSKVAHLIETTKKDQLLEVSEKQQHDYVTQVDKLAENELVKELNALLPEAGFIAEESGIRDKTASYQWIVDPIDGTTNFINGIPFYAISVALAHNQELQLGVVYEITRGEAFYAWKGGGAYLNNTPINTSPTLNLNQSVLAFGFPYVKDVRLDNYMNLLKACTEQSAGLRRLGSAALDLAYVACGRIAGFFEYGLNPWDVAAGMLIINEAGGRSSNFLDDPNDFSGRTVIGTNGNIHSELLSLIAEHISQ